MRRRTFNYVLRDINRALWDRAKHRAASEGRSLRFVILELVRVYAESGFVIVEAWNHKKKR